MLPSLMLSSRVATDRMTPVTATPRLSRLSFASALISISMGQPMRRDG